MRWIGLIGILRFIKISILKILLYFFTTIINSIVFLSMMVFSKKNWFKKFLFIFFLLTIISIILIYSYAAYIWKQEIDISKMKEYRPIMSSRILDKNNTLITEFATERRIFVSIDKISKHIINAFISAEDRTFYKNPGIDIQGLIRAGIMDVFYFFSGKKLHGASTITQQVVRNTILSNERTITRKIKEMALSYKISKIMSKNEIMEIYLNQIYLGSKSYGVEAASNEYFGKSAQDLSIDESALIASLTKAPSTLDPRRGKSATLFRRNWIINAMQSEGYITKDQMKEAISEPIHLTQKQFIQKPYSYIDYIVHYLQKENSISKENLEHDGYKIKTNFDYEIYNMAYNALNNGIKKYDKRHGYKGAIGKCNDIKKFTDCLYQMDVIDLIGTNIMAVILAIEKDNVKIGLLNNETGIINIENFKWARKRLENLQIGSEITSSKDVFELGDIIIVSKVENDKYALEQIPEINGGVIVMKPQTGDIVAMVGGYLDIPGTFNRAFQAKRQPGSVAKTFAYLAALEAGFKPSDIIIDSDIQIATGGGGAWMPKNDSKKHTDAITVRRAFERSLNSPLARLMNDIGQSKLPEVLSRLGVAKNAESNLSTALGTFDTTILDILSGYATIINGGIKIKNCPIIKIEKIGDANKFINTIVKSENANDTQLYEGVEDIMGDLSSTIFTSQNGDQLIDKRIAFQLTSMLQGSALRGTSAKFGTISPNLLGKTGTTDDAKDLWFIGGSSEYLIGVYIGYDIPKSLGLNEYGGTTALPIASDIMSQIILKYTPKPLSPPDGIKFVNIDIDTGRPSNRKDARVIKESFFVDDAVGNQSNDNNLKHEDLSGIY